MDTNCTLTLRVCVCRDSRSAKVVSQYKEVGTADLPKTRAAWIEIGHDIQRQVASAQLA